MSLDALVDLFGLSKRPKVPKDLILGELIINVQQHQGDPLMTALKPTLFVTVPTTMKVYDLRFRIHGLTSIPVSRIRLMLCGEVLKDHETVPDWAYEVTKKLHEDDDLYKARIFLSMSPAPDVEEKEEVQSVVSELSEHSMDEEEKEAMEKMNAEREEAKKKEEEERIKNEKKAQELEALTHSRHHKKSKYFELEKDLERIECAHFAPALKEAGLDSEGTFSEITEDVLTVRGLYIPRRSRVRIVALADSIKRRIDQRDNVQRTAALAEVNEQMRDGGKNKGRAIEGMKDGPMNNKSDVNKFFAEKEKQAREADREDRLRRQAAERRQYLREHPEARETKPHDPKTAHAIKLIRWKNDRDEHDIPKNVMKVVPSVFCCKKHEKEVLEKRATFVKERRERTLDEVNSAIRVADKSNTGFLRRELLKAVAEKLFESRKCSITEAEVEKLLDDSEMGGHYQDAVFHWIGQEKYRANNPLGFLPVTMHDTKYFSETVVAMLDNHEYSKHIMREEDKEGKYVVREVKSKFKSKKEEREEKASRKQKEEERDEDGEAGDVLGGVVESEKQDNEKGSAKHDSRRNSSQAASRHESRRNSLAVQSASRRGSLSGMPPNLSRKNSLAARGSESNRM